MFHDQADRKGGGLIPLQCDPHPLTIFGADGWMNGRTNKAVPRGPRGPKKALELLLRAIITGIGNNVSFILNCQHEDIPLWAYCHVAGIV